MARSAQVGGGGASSAGWGWGLLGVGLGLSQAGGMGPDGFTFEARDREFEASERRLFVGYPIFLRFFRDCLVSAVAFLLQLAF